MYCKHCGHELNSDNICTNPECPSNTDTNFNEDNHNTSEYTTNQWEFRDENGVSVSEMTAFFGDKKADYYLDKWNEYQSNENFISWNWPAFLCGFYWFWYRKMYSIMAIILAVSICGTMILPDWAGSILSLGIIIGCGLFSNQLYMRHATRKVTSIKSALNRGINYDVVMRRIRTNGGTTIAPIIVFSVLFVLLTILLLIGLVLGVSLIDPSTVPLY